MEKATFRLPEWEMERPRQQSERQSRSLNEIVIDVIASGLGEPPCEQELLRALGQMVSRPAIDPCRPAPAGDHLNLPDLTDALKWTRGDR